MTEERRSEQEEDDGRVIADMSSVERPNLYSFRRIREKSRTGENSRPRSQMGAEERHLYILAAVRAGLLIVLAFAAGLATVIALFILFGK